MDGVGRARTILNHIPLKVYMDQLSHIKGIYEVNNRGINMTLFPFQITKRAVF